MRPHRRQPLYLAFLLHRISGLALALFLPFHFFALALVLTDPGEMDRFLHWSQIPLVKLSEVVLVFLLAMHLFGGLRLLALENMPWRDAYKNAAALALACAFFVACGFLLRSFA